MSPTLLTKREQSLREDHEITGENINVPRCPFINLLYYVGGVLLRCSRAGSEGGGVEVGRGVGGWGSWVPEPRPGVPPCPQNVPQSGFCFVLYLPFPPVLVCLLFLTTIMNKGNRGVTASLFFEVFLFPWEIRETIKCWIPKYKKRPKTTLQMLNFLGFGGAPQTPLSRVWSLDPTRCLGGPMTPA